MSISSDYSLADIAAATGNNGNNNGMGWGGDWSAWIIIFLIFAAFGWGGNGNGFFGGGSNGAAENYVLASDFATLQRQMSDGFNVIERRTDNIVNGICDLGYTQQALINNVGMSVMQGNNALASQIAQCCCDVREAISGVNLNMATNTNAISRQIADCCCTVERQIERGFADTNYNLATQNCATLSAIDKVGDRIIDYMANEKMQTLRDENQALRLAASQERQNQYLISQLGYQCPKPAYVVQPPQQVTFPTNCCGGVNYAGYNNGCGCGCGCN